MDEFGPLEVKPVEGYCWAKEKHPDRLPAEYHRPHGIQYLFAAYDLAKDKLFGQIHIKRSWNEFLGFLKWIRKKYSISEKLYIILDNLAVHKKEEVLKYCNNSNIRLEFLPTYSSWLNRIECHFTPLKKFVIRNSNYKSREEQATAIYKYLKWRNSKRKRRTNFN